MPASAHYSADVLIRISLFSLLVVGGRAVSLPSLLNASLTEILESDSYRQSIITAPSKVGPSAPSHI